MEIIRVETIIVIIIVILFIGFIVYQMTRKDKNGDGSGGSGIGDNPPSFLKIISPHYGLYDRNYGQFLDMLQEYKANALRIFAYGGGSSWPDFRFKLWSGNYMGDVIPDKMNQIISFVKEANKRGIWVIISLTQNNSGGHTEDITSRNKGEIATYLSKIIPALKDYGVIFETANEIDDKGFQEYVRDKVKEFGGRYTCSYSHHIGCDYKNVHVKQKSYVGGGVIHSNDKDGYTNYYNNGDYINIARQAKEQGGHFEFLMFWSKKGELNSPDEIKRDYGDVLEAIRGL
jgi:hypothetical protein